MKKYNSIDLPKFILAIFVIAIHTEPLVNINNHTINSIYESLVSIAVPMFFLFSGFFLGKKFKNKSNKEKTLIIKKALFNFIKIYVLLSIIYLPLTIYYLCVYGKKTAGFDSFIFTTIISIFVSFGIIKLGEIYKIKGSIE